MATTKAAIQATSLDTPVSHRVGRSLETKLTRLGFIDGLAGRVYGRLLLHNSSHSRTGGQSKQWTVGLAAHLLKFSRRQKPWNGLSLVLTWKSGSRISSIISRQLQNTVNTSTVGWTLVQRSRELTHPLTTIKKPHWAINSQLASGPYLPCSHTTAASSVMDRHSRQTEPRPSHNTRGALR